MFDANARHLPNGHLFFAEVHWCSSEPLCEFGIEKDDLLLCCMLSDCNDNPKVCIVKNSKGLVVDNNDHEMESFLVYSGNYDLTGFICDKQKARAEQIIKFLTRG